jgi:hypothetical protein
VMQSLMGEMQGLIKTLQDKMMVIQKESAQEFKDLKEKEDAKK